MSRNEFDTSSASFYPASEAVQRLITLRQHAIAHGLPEQSPVLPAVVYESPTDFSDFVPVTEPKPDVER